MSQVVKTSLRWTAALYVLACTPLVLLLLNCVRDAYCDVQMIHTVALRTETSRLRSRAVSQAQRLEFVLGMHEAGASWDELRDEEWLQAEWKKMADPSPHDLYSAVVDPQGVIVLHSDPSRVGNRLGYGWYERRVPEAGDGVVRARNSALAPKGTAIDVRTPLIVHNREIGQYHEGLDAAWFDREVAALQRDALQGWLWFFGLAIAADIGAVYALYVLARRHQQLRRRTASIETERSNQLAQIASGLAHEIRNPLHALRLNLHALGKSLTGKAKLSQEELLDTVRESDLEIGHLESLLRDLIRFANPEAGKQVELNVVSEVQATLNLMNEEMRDKGIEVASRWPDEAVAVSCDPARLRQMLVNLLTFAQNNAGNKGRIEVEVNRRGKQAEVVVADSGPPLSQTQIRRVFEPFQAPRETGSGLGLALVQAFATEAGGSATCEVGPSRGNRFRLLLPDSMPRR